MTRVYLYSDQPILAKGLEAVLIVTGRLQLESSYSGIPELVKRLQTDAPDILLLDLTPEVTFGVLSDIKRVVQESKLVLWVNAISTELAFQAMGLGVRGILRKTLPVELQVKCLQKVHEGELWFEKALTDSFLAAKRVALSQREGQLITLLSRGLKNKEIAFILQITEGTVKVYLSHLFQKVGVKDRFDLAFTCARQYRYRHRPQTTRRTDRLGRSHAGVPRVRHTARFRRFIRQSVRNRRGRRRIESRRGF
jgi:two-component system nitrate/nitrite response regulator NarL